MATQRMPLDFSGGVNLLTDPRGIAPNEAVALKNLAPARNGVLASRGGVARVGDGYVSGGAYDQCVSFHIPSYPGIDYIAVIRDSTNNTAKLIVGDWDAGSILLERTLPEFVGYRPKFVDYRGSTFVVHGSAFDYSEGDDPGGNHFGFQIWPGSPTPNIFPLRVFNGGIAIENVPPVRVAFVYNGRFVLGHLGEGRETSFYVTDGAPTQVMDAATGDYWTDANIDLPAGPGDELVAGCEIAQTAAGTPTTRAALLLCRRSAYLLTGETLFSTETPDAVSGYAGSAELNTINYPCGCASAETLVMTPYGYIWASQDDVWMFNTGQLPVRIGSKIRPALEKTPREQTWQWSAVYADGFYRLSVYGDGQGTEDFGKMGEQWWLDLRNGPPQSHQDARWFGPMVYNISEEYDTTPLTGTWPQAYDVREGAHNKLRSLHRGVASSANNVDGLHVVAFDMDTAYDSALALNDSRYTGVGTELWEDAEVDNEVEWEILTREFDNDAPTLDKNVRGVELNMWTNDMLRLNVESIIDGGLYTDTQSVNVDAKGSVLGVQALGEVAIPRAWQRVLVPDNPDDHKHGTTWQLRITPTPGYPVIQGTNSYAPFKWVPTETTYQIQLDDGFHADMDTLLDAINTQLNLVSGGVLTFIAANWSAPTKHITLEETGSADEIYFRVTGTGIYAEFRKLLAWMGFDTTVDEYSGNYLYTAGNGYRRKLSCRIQIASALARVEQHGRLPR